MPLTIQKTTNFHQFPVHPLLLFECLNVAFKNYKKLHTPHAPPLINLLGCGPCTSTARCNNHAFDKNRGGGCGCCGTAPAEPHIVGLSLTGGGGACEIESAGI
jgi:hypothetical protein